MILCHSLTDIEKLLLQDTLHTRWVR